MQPRISTKSSVGRKHSSLSVFFASQKGTASVSPSALCLLQDRGIDALAIDLTGFDTDRLVEHSRACFIVATYAGGKVRCQVRALLSRAFGDVSRLSCRKDLAGGHHLRGLWLWQLRVPIKKTSMHARGDWTARCVT